MHIHKTKEKNAKQKQDTKKQKQKILIKNNVHNKL